MKMMIAKIADAQHRRERWCHKYFGEGAREDVVMLYTDISRAYFNAPAQRDKYIEIPQEDGDEDDAKYMK